MHLNLVAESMFLQMRNLLSEITDEVYVSPVASLSGATIGGHTRHIIEFFMELMLGYDNGTVNYDNRKRDHQTETNRYIAMDTLHTMSDRLSTENKNLLLVSNFTGDPSETFTTPTHYTRELIYNIEHTVHHMALIRVAVNSLTDLRLPPSFGVAAATIQYRKACAQ